MNLISVPFSQVIHQRLARLSEKSGLSAVTLIRHAVKKQLPLWEGNGGESETAASRSIGKSQQSGGRRKIKAGKHSNSKL